MRRVALGLFLMLASPWMWFFVANLFEHLNNRAYGYTNANFALAGDLTAFLVALIVFLLGLGTLLAEIFE